MLLIFGRMKPRGICFSEEEKPLWKEYGFLISPPGLGPHPGGKLFNILNFNTKKIDKY
jgi:hypothetical protein